MLKRLKHSRQANVEQAVIEHYALRLEGSEEAIEAAVSAWEMRPAEEYQPRWPELARLQQTVREQEVALRAPSLRFPFCSQCENDGGFLYYSLERRGRRLRGEEIGGAENRFAVKCECGGSYWQPRSETHYSMGNVMLLFQQRQQMRATGETPPPLSKVP